MSALEETSVNSHTAYGVSGGTKFTGFLTFDKGNYANQAPCEGCEGVSGAALSSIQSGPAFPKPSDSTPVSTSSLSSWMNVGARATPGMTVHSGQTQKTTSLPVFQSLDRV